MDGEEWERKRDSDVSPLSWTENNIIVPAGCCEITRSQWKMTGELRFLISTWQPWWSNYNSTICPLLPLSSHHFFNPSPSSSFYILQPPHPHPPLPSSVIFLINPTASPPPLASNRTLFINMSTMETCDDFCSVIAANVDTPCVFVHNVFV